MISSSQIVSYLRGKSVVLVGPAASLKGSRQGDLIDSHDVVVRLNLGCPVPVEMRADIGTRTDILFHVLFGKQHADQGYKHTESDAEAWKAAGVKFVATRHTASHRRVRAIKPLLNTVQIPIVPMTQAFSNKMKRSIVSHKSPNTGIIAIQWLLDCGVKSLYITGFDFYTTGYYAGYGGFSEDRAAMGVGGKAMWGEYDYVPHAQTEQLQYLVDLYYRNHRLILDKAAADALGVPLKRSEKIIALVPIKAESERLPGKNIKSIAGRPLLDWALMNLQASHLTSQIVVDTDNKDIAAMVRKYSKVKVIMRPEHLYGGHITANDLIGWEMSQVADTEQHFMFTHVTSPLLKPQTIDRAIGRYFDGLNTEHDSLFGVTAHHIRLFDADMRPIGHNPAKLARTQDLEPLYEDNSAFYMFSRTSFDRASGRIGHKPTMFPISKIEAVDIDTEEDFAIAQALLSARKGKR